MEDIKKRCLLIAVIMGIILNIVPAQAETQISQAGKWGIGAELNAVNFALGPMVRYWVTDNIGGQATYSALVGFQGFSIKGLYEFSKKIEIANEELNPFLGIGYTSLKKKERDITYKGSGASLSAGLEGNLKHWHPNLYYTTEFIYSPFEIEGEMTSTFEDWYGNSYTETTSVTTDFSSFGIGASLIYYF
jgi:hypothetical protein